VTTTLRADPGWQTIDLLSDVHLHAAMPRTFEVWRRHLLTTPADAVLMLGDLFEVWVGDDARFHGFERDCAAVLREASSRRALAFLPGNRDFLVGDDLLAACGVMRLSDPTLLEAFGQRLLLTHGDALCLADTDYQQFRRLVRSDDWQRRFLALPLAERQAQARAMRDASMAHQAEMPPEQWSDVDDDAATAWLADACADVMVHGHTHRPAVHALGSGRLRHVLGDWDLDGSHPRARLLRLTRAGLETLDLAQP
jgi:UDP-2,3-diacylglucosamine hydrolase